MLRAAMTKQQVTQTALAIKAGVHASYLSHLLGGQKWPDPNVLVRLADALGWTMAQRGQALGLIANEKAARPGSRAATSDAGEAA